MDQKQCHNCLRSKDIDQFRSYYMWPGEGPFKVFANNCLECEADGCKERTYRIDRNPGVNTLREDKYLCAFIGDKSYRYICKVYGIKYENK